MGRNLILIEKYTEYNWKERVRSKIRLLESLIWVEESQLVLSTSERGRESSLVALN